MCVCVCMEGRYICVRKGGCQSHAQKKDLLANAVSACLCMCVRACVRIVTVTTGARGRDPTICETRIETPLCMGWQMFDTFAVQRSTDGTDVQSYFVCNNGRACKSQVTAHTSYITYMHSVGSIYRAMHHKRFIHL